MVQIKVQAVEGRLLVDGQDMGGVTGFVPNGEYTLTLDGGAELAAGMAAPEATGFPNGAKAYLRGNTFIGEGVIDRTDDNGDVLIRLTETGKLIRVFANEVGDMLTSPTRAYLTNPGEVQEGDGVYLDGVTFRGLAKVETFKDGDAILRMPKDERSGRENVRLRVKQEDFDSQRLSRPVAKLDDFAPEQPVVARGKRYAGEGQVLNTDGGTVSIRLADGGGRRGRGTRLAFDANDLAAGRLERA